VGRGFMETDSEFERLLRQVAEGSDEAALQLVETYTPFIIRSVRLALSPKLRPKLDSHDIAQALWASLLLGDVDLSRIKTPEALIAFLARAAKNKVASQARRHGAQKRNIDAEVSQDSRMRENRATDSSVSALDRDPTPSKLIAVRERWNHLLAKASERDQRIVEMRIDRKSFDEISLEVNVSQMTARRVIDRIIDEFCQ